MDYSKTLNLPETDFPMRGNLPTREPETLQKWNDMDLYGGLMDKNADKPLFVLHDGPPYANGDMHMGHALNKTLKDIIVRYKNMSGYRAPYIHGWDTHGLPIERQAIKKLGINRSEVSITDFRELCKEFALGYVENQKSQIRRLGSLGDYDNSYITLDPKFEAKQIEIFGEMAKKGYIYKGLKPIYWCPDCETALAEAEIEYKEDKTNSIYVKFLVSDDKGLFADVQKPVYFVIWTTTTWTLPGNVAIAVNPEFSYSLIECEGEVYIIATELVVSVMTAGNIKEYKEIKTIRGSELEYIKCNHPFMDRTSLVIVGDHVTLDAGTGCVHTAPGHGAEDYDSCRKYKEIPIVVPVDDKGYLNDLAGEFSGLFYAKANPAIEEKLKEVNALFAIREINHQYPHCWRCHEPIVFRATEQWFASVDSIKDDAVKAIQKVQWIPKWGEERITSMVLDRTDWCISRQRTWGVPIPIFYCAECGEALVNDDTIRQTADLFREKGSGAWYELDASEILSEGTKCKCGHTNFTKEKDIMDVWFDSGSSHAGVLEVKEGLTFPADMYLEGNDQYRGWFQSSLLTSIAAKGVAPYKTVITHGMIVDSDGQKMSKSKGNGVSPQDIVNEFGADILRLWVVSADFKTDMRISKDILKQMSEVYRKIRNTARYILGNIHDFDPETHSVSDNNMDELDLWALMRLDQMTKKVLAAYESYDFHMIYHTIHNFCVVDMSNFYLDIVKDRLYVEKPDSLKRRATQTVIYRVLDTIVRLLAPVLVYTTEEIWAHMPHRSDDDVRSVLYNDMPKPEDKAYDDAFVEKWDKLLAIRADVSKSLEMARAEKKIGNSVGACVALYVSEELEAFLKSFGDSLAELFIVSGVEIHKTVAPADAFCGETEGLHVTVLAPNGQKCERCWLFSTTVGDDAAHPNLCKRCADIIKE